VHLPTLEAWKAEVAGWLHTEIDVRHRELNPATATHLSTNRAQRRLTPLIEANVLTTTPDHQPVASTGSLQESSVMLGAEKLV